MTEAEIIKSLRCCAENTLDACEECPACAKCEQLCAEAADLLIAKQKAENTSWISVKDRLPEPLEDVLVYYISGKVDIDWVDHSKMFCFEAAFGCVTHWIPLPEPPKGDNK